MSNQYLLLVFLLFFTIEVTTAAKLQPDTIQWAPCDLDLGNLAQLENAPLDCARLSVPLDYTDPECQHKLSLQLMKRNATKIPFKGSVIFNPGGPGGSGIEDLVIAGALYNDVLGGQFDLIAFDPRGTGKTIPFDCQLGNETTASVSASLVKGDALPQQNMTELLLSKYWQDTQKIADQCYEVLNETGSFLGTAFVARDVMEIVDALNEDGMLRYWGISYGTMLGATIAAMFPDRIDRMYLDSVVNPVDYMSGNVATWAHDSDKALRGYFEGCVAAGPAYCAVANLSGPATTPEDLLVALQAVLQELSDNPQYLPNNSIYYGWDPYSPLSMYDHLKTAIFGTLYSPAGWSYLADVLAEILLFDFTSLITEIMYYPEYSEGVNAFWGIACSDVAYRAASPDDMFGLVRQQQNVSSFSDVVLTNLWPCYQWKMSAAERYTGNFSVNTSHPILFTNGQYDPITPYASAVNASAAFKGSVLLTHGGHGHSVYAQPSKCTARAVRAYFINGTLPQSGTYCEPELPTFIYDYTDVQVLFNGSWNIDSRAVKLDDNSDDMEMMQTLYKLATYLWEKTQRHGIWL